MTGFLVIFFTLYTAMHAVFYLRVRVLLPERRFLHPLFVLFLLLMIVAPLISRLLERSGHEATAKYLAVIAFNWTGFIFIAFCGAMVMLTIDGCLWALNYFGGANLPLLTGRYPSLFLVGIVLSLCAYGYMESRAIQTERIRIETAKLPPGTDRLKIVQISDVHIGLLTQRTVLNRIAEEVAAENPDVVVSTGDFVDGMNGHLSDLSGLFERIEARLGKFAVTGNHEFYTGLSRASEFTRKFGFTLLRGEVRTVGSVLNIVGVDDPAVSDERDEAELLSSVQNGLFTLLLKHRPWVSKSSRGRFDLQLSGHTHGGQIYPFIHVVSLQYPLPVGMVALQNGSFIYTSRGSGTWGPQMRLLSKPEVTVFELVRK
ncbi:MAG: metallophosphoesterase [Thermodesulfobacteriota bacterium]